MIKGSYLICFIGIDGAGKSTLTRRLTEELARNGIKARYVMARFEKFVLLQPARWIVKKVFFSGKKTDYSAEGVRTRRRVFKKRSVAGFWQWALMLDYSLQLGFKVRLPLMRGRSVCADRYVFDTAVDLAADLALPASGLQKRLAALLCLAPRPDLVFLVDLPEEIAYQRNLAKHDNLPLEYFKERRKLYLRFRSRPEVTVLNGGQTPDDLFAAVLQKLRAQHILTDS